MISRPQKRCLPALALGMSFFLLLLLFLYLMLFPAAPAPAAPVLLGEGAGYTLFRGAPEMQGSIHSISRVQLLKGYLMQVSPAHPLPQDFPQPDTHQLRVMVGAYLPAEEGVTLCRDAVYALCAIQLEHSLHEGATLIRGALSYAQQEDWRREAFARYAKVYPLHEALSRAYAAVPGGGESEHQLGYALDISLSPPLSLGEREPLMRNETGKWLKENLWRFGWIQRYGPSAPGEGGCEDIHLRYVGKIHAAAMHAAGLGLEDYLSLLRSHGRLTLCRDGAPYAYIYCAPCQDGWALPVPEGTEYQVSADNTGWAVAAIAADTSF